MIEQVNLKTEQTAPDSESKNESLIKQTEGKTAGQILRAAREAQGVDIGLLASNLKVTARQLEQLELDQYDQLPDMAFTRNFAISVARRLKVDDKLIADLLPKMDSLASSSHLVKHTHDARGALMKKDVLPYKKRSKLWWFLLFVLLVVLLAFLFFLPQLGQKRYDQDHTLTSVQTNETGSTSSARFITREVGISNLNARSEPATIRQNVASADSLQAVSVQALAPASSSEGSGSDTNREGGPLVVSSSNTVEQEQSAEPTTASALPGNTISAVNENDKLEVRAGSESWLRIQTASGKILYEGLVKKGDAYVLLLKKDELPLSIRIGKATDVVVTVRGKPLNLSSSIVGDIANFKVE